MVVTKYNVENLKTEWTWQMFKYQIYNQVLALYLINSIRSLNNGMLLRSSSTEISLYLEHI